MIAWLAGSVNCRGLMVNKIDIISQSSPFGFVKISMSIY